MKKIMFAICTAFVLGLVFSTSMSEVVAEQPILRVGLHDRLLDLKDVRVIEGDEKVPLSEIAQAMYITLEKENNIIYIRKSGNEISYDEVTKQTWKNGTEIDGSPIVNIDGTLFISVKYIAQETGFKIGYLPKIQTLRIYRDDYDHLSHPEYEQHVQQWLAKKQPTKSQVKLTEKSKTNVYLTFDDGPNKFTAVNKATLKKYNVQGTFFFLGKHMKNNEKLVKIVADDGHYIGTHSMTHDKDKIYKSSKSFIDEMNEGTKLILQMTGQDAKLLRVPYGSKPHVTPAMKEQLNLNGYKMWDWDVDSYDWKYTDDQTNEIVNNVRMGVEKSYKSGDRNIIILLHDRSQTTKALPQIIEWLQKEGYTTKTYEPEQHIIQNFLRDTTL